MLYLCFLKYEVNLYDRTCRISIQLSPEKSRLSSLLSSRVMYVLAVSGPLLLNLSTIAFMFAIPTLRFSNVGP